MSNLCVLQRDTAWSAVAPERAYLPRHAGVWLLLSGGLGPLHERGAGGSDDAPVLARRAGRRSSRWRTQPRRAWCWQTRASTSWAPTRTSASPGGAPPCLRPPPAASPCDACTCPACPQCPPAHPGKRTGVRGRCQWLRPAVLVVCRDAICGLILGSPPGKVYSKLRSVCTRLNSSY